MLVVSASVFSRVGSIEDREAWCKVVNKDIEVGQPSNLVKPARDLIRPKTFPDVSFKLLNVSYDGKCEVEQESKGNFIKAPR